MTTYRIDHGGVPFDAVAYINHDGSGSVIVRRDGRDVTSAWWVAGRAGPMHETAQPMRAELERVFVAEHAAAVTRAQRPPWRRGPANCGVPAWPDGLT